MIVERIMKSIFPKVENKMLNKYGVKILVVTLSISKNIIN